MLGGLEWPEGMAELALVCPFPPTVLTKAQSSTPRSEAFS